MLFAILAIIFHALLEFVWISSMRAFYNRSFRRIQSDWSGKYKIIPAVLAYIVLWGVIYILLLRDVKTPIINAIALGLGIYGVYNLTNMATLDRYSWPVALIDTTWGVFSMVAVLLFYKFLLLKNGV